jgi:hypothetical protein
VDFRGGLYLPYLTPLIPLLLVLLLLPLQAHRGEGGDAMDVDGEEDELLVRGAGLASPTVQHLTSWMPSPAT